MPPEGENAYGRPYGDPYGDTYGDPYGQRDEDDPYSSRASQGSWAYGQGEDFQRAVDALDDPLSDPLPGQSSRRAGSGQAQGGQVQGGGSHPGQGYPGQSRSAQGYQPQNQPGQGYQAQGTAPGYGSRDHSRDQGSQGYAGQDRAAQGYEPGAYGTQGQQQGQQAPQAPQAGQEPGGVSPWFRPHRETGPGPAAGQGQQPGGHSAQGPVSSPRQDYGSERQVPYAGGQSGTPQQWHEQGQGWQAEAGTAAGPPVTRKLRRPSVGNVPGQAPDPVAPTRAPGAGRPEHGQDAAGPVAPHRPEARFSETSRLPVVDEPGGTPSRTARGTSSGPSTAHSASGLEDDDRTNTRTVGLVRPGSQEFTGRAARRRAAQHRGRGGSVPPPPPAGTRLEARRAERARREGPAIIASRFLGEVFISAGVLMLLFVAYQLWWTNVLAGQEAGGAAQSLQDQWDGGGKNGKQDPERKAGDFAPGEGFAILYLPKLDVRVPIAQGVSKPAVLDKGLVGHYDKQPFKTAMPWDTKGNFALAGHRNTHGEPFRYINRLVAGDDIVVETATKFYTYKMANRLPSTSPSNTRVIEPVPQGSGFERPGRYVTLTTCTPEFTSKYRLIVWGKMVEERPRSKGKPDALVE